ncbi:ribonuclease VapC [Candidatus Woesearchaeota archaeon]|nr:ribonuclease VapC [Candidatus Woesearchaeota archaeon]
MKTIVLDTNFLIYCAKYKIDFFSEIDRLCFFPYKLAVVDETITELEKVKPKELNLIKKFIEKIQVIKSNENYVDKELISLSKKGFIIATQDLELKKKLECPVIVIRQKKYLELRNKA